MTSLNISLTDALARIVRRKVKSGLYTDASEVVSEAIRHLDANEELLHELKLARLKQALSSGIEEWRGGRLFPLDMRGIRQRLDAKTQN